MKKQKPLTTQELIDGFQNLNLEEQIAHKKAVDLILEEKKKNTEAELKLLKEE